MRDAGRRRRGGGAAVSVPPGRHGRAVRRGRPYRYGGAHPGRGDADIPWAAGGDRERDGRVGHHRRRTRRARGPRRLHGEHRQLVHACRQRRHLRAAVRSAQGPDRVARLSSNPYVVVGARAAGSGPQELVWLRPIPTARRRARGPLRTARQRRLLPEHHQRPSNSCLIAPAPRNHARPGGRTHRFELRPGRAALPHVQWRREALPSPPVRAWQLPDAKRWTSRRARPLHLDVERPVGAKEHAARYHQPAQRRSRGCLADPAVRQRLGDLG